MILNRIMMILKAAYFASSVICIFFFYRRLFPAKTAINERISALDYLMFVYQTLPFTCVQKSKCELVAGRTMGRRPEIRAVKQPTHVGLRPQVQQTRMYFGFDCLLFAMMPERSRRRLGDSSSRARRTVSKSRATSRVCKGGVN
jgi:hypothetical protein